VVEMALLEHVLDADQGVGKTGVHLGARSPLHHLESRLVFPKTASDFRGDATAFIKRYRTSIRAEL